jgi:hypothetical protein
VGHTLCHLTPTSRGFSGPLFPVLALLAHFRRIYTLAPIKSWRTIHKLDNAKNVQVYGLVGVAVIPHNDIFRKGNTFESILDGNLFVAGDDGELNGVKKFNQPSS